jgi:hypothetical protein
MLRPSIRRKAHTPAPANYSPCFIGGLVSSFIDDKNTHNTTHLTNTKKHTVCQQKT